MSPARSSGRELRIRSNNHLSLSVFEGFIAGCATSDPLNLGRHVRDS